MEYDIPRRENEMKNQYDLFANYYEMLTDGVDYDMWYEYLLSIGSLKKEESKGKKVLDLGCGSGELLSLFYIDGFHCFGVDNSSEMLSRCDEALFKNKKTNRFATLIQRDMQSVLLDTKFDFVYSACDSINYLNLSELGKLIENVCKMLKDDCIFTFDMINPEKFTSTEKISDGETTLYINRLRVDNKLLTDIEITGEFDKEKINFVQYAFSEDDIFQIVKSLGSGKVEFYDFLCHEKTAELSEKIQVVIKK